MNGIQITDLTFYYSERKQHAIIDSFSLEIEKGSITGITGKSGCGKSTLFSLLAGIYPEYAGVLESGSIRYDGQNVHEMTIRDRAKVVSLMFQNPDLQFCMDTVENELIFCLENIQIPKTDMDDRIEEALEFCSIEHLRNRTVQTLSGGEKQMVSLACIVALGSEYLLLDEPFANIDPETAEQLWQKLNQLNQEKGKTIVLIDHQVNTPGSHVDKWIVLHQKDQKPEIIEYLPNDLNQQKWFDAHGITVHGFSTIHTISQPKLEKKGSTLFDLKNAAIKKDKVSILDNVTFSIPENAITVLTGKSGSGKSTLFSVLAKMLTYQGEIMYKNKAVKEWKLKTYAKRVGIVFQNPQDQFVASTVCAEMEISLKESVSSELLDDEVKKYLSSIQLWAYRDFSPYMLSQGQQRRLAVAVLLAHQCDVLLCDEPTYGQDKHNIKAIMDLLTYWMKENDLTVVFSTHDHILAKEYADVQIECKDKTVYVVRGER